MRPKEYYIDMYLEYLNNYLTIEQFAIDQGMSYSNAKTTIEIGRLANEELANKNIVKEVLNHVH